MYLRHKLGVIVVILAFLVLFFLLLDLLDRHKEVEVTYLNLRERLPTVDSKLFDLNFKYLFESDLCANTSDILAVIIVTSYFGNVETRSAMRQTFTNEKLSEFKLKRVFLLGVAPDDKYTQQNAILDENKRYDDLVQGNFNEAYRNLTYKHVMGLNWVTTNCRQAKFVIKMDDDIVFNLYKVVEILSSLIVRDNNLLAGYVLRKMTPIRLAANKWHVTESEYKNTFYPTFVSGWFYITTPSVCEKLSRLARATPYFWIDDVYVTGILALKLPIKHLNLKDYYTVHPEFLECCMRDVRRYKYECEVVIGPNGGNSNLFLNFNEIMRACYYGKCVNRTKSLDDTCVAEKKYSMGKGNAFVETYKLV